MEIRSFEEPLLTKHGRVAIQRRGVSRDAIRIVLDWHDTDLEAGGGCRTIRLSRRCLAELRSEGIAPQALERLPRLRLVLRENDGALVTSFSDAGRRGRRYRRQHPTRRARMAGW